MPEASPEEKATISSLEKKLKELETTVNNLKKSLESLEELKQRLDDVEDLVMVENALTIEMKRMMEDLKGESEKISSLKKEFEMHTPPSEETNRLLLEELKVLKDRIDSIEESLTTGDKKELEAVTHEIESKTADLNNLLVKLKAEKLSVENLLGRMKTELETLNTSMADKKAVLADLLKIKLGTGRMAASDVEGKISFLEKEISAIKSALNQLSGKSTQDERLGKLLERIDSLEAKVAALEQTVKSSLKSSPMIIE